MQTDAGRGGSSPWLSTIDRLIAACQEAEDALFGTVPILGEPLAQATIDHWVDQGVDATRRLAGHARELRDRRAVLDFDHDHPDPRTASTPGHEQVREIEQVGVWRECP
ncbi:MAG TPA: hypothetical protein PK428_05685 [Phycicoccus sp.]|jgi:hypothetical protein|nr:hypothetical protein [Phycicoccus sp.]